MSSRLAIALVGAIAIAACSGNPGGSDLDAAVVDGDGNEIPTAGLRIELEADPAPDGDFGGDFDPSLDTVEVVLSDFRAIGDAAPGDERTSVSSLSLTFSESDTETVRFADAPVGRYSRVRARLDRFYATGSCDIDDETLTWEIEDDPPGGIEIDIQLTPVDLEPGVEGSLTLEVRLDRPYNEIDWDELNQNNGVIRVDSSSGEIDKVREKLGELFRQK